MQVFMALKKVMCLIKELNANSEIKYYLLVRDDLILTFFILSCFKYISLKNM